MSTPAEPPQDVLFLADALYLLAHDELSGKPRLPEGILGLGLAGALLGELALAEKVSVRGELLMVTDAEPPVDGVAAGVHERLLRSVAPRPARDWLAYFADDAVVRVRERLSNSGRLEAQPPRLGRGVRYMPTDKNAAEKVALGLCTKVMRRAPLDAASGLLAGLIGATDLRHSGLFEVGDTPQARRYLHESLRLLSPPTLRELIRLTQAAVAAAVVTQRA